MSSELLAQFAQLERDHNTLELQRSNMVIHNAQALLSTSGLVVDVAQPVGELVDAVSEMADDTRIIVIGKRGEQAGYATGHLGSNLERVVRAAHVPVLVAAVKYTPVTRIALAYDGGANANIALDYIVKHAMFAGVECHLIGVGPESTRNELPMAKAAGILAQSHHSVHVHYQEGQVDDVLGNYIVTHNIDMLLMGAYSHSPLRNLFIGSTTNAMLQSCPVSVLLFR
jgi:nucleotide-binding universal stress UspA family protein